MSVFLAKINESEYPVPCLDVLNFVSEEAFSSAAMQQMERTILEALDCEVTETNVASFIDYYVTDAVAPEDYHFEAQVGDVVHAAMEIVWKYVEYFLPVCLQGQPINLGTDRQKYQPFLHVPRSLAYNLRIYKPSLVAASIVAAARSSLHLMPIWPRRLEEKTGYEYAQLSDSLFTVSTSKTR